MYGLEVGPANTSSRPGNRVVKVYPGIYRQAAGGCSRWRETFNEEYVQVVCSCRGEEATAKGTVGPLCLIRPVSRFLLCWLLFSLEKAPAPAPRRRRLHHQGQH